jgi:colanic acid biosynthesis glycosyl transferase WcaI
VSFVLYVRGNDPHDGSLIKPIPAPDNELRSAWGLRDHFVVGYAGNLGRAHDIDTVLKATAALRGVVSPKPIRFLFVGGGALRPRLEAEAARLSLTNVEFRDYQPREHLAAALCVADVHLVILNPKLEGLIVPSKFYAVAAAGRPVIFIGDRSGELARIVDEEGIGFAVPPSHPGELKQRILQLAASPQLCRIMGTRERSVFERLWDKPVAIERWRGCSARKSRRLAWSPPPRRLNLDRLRSSRQPAALPDRRASLLEHNGHSSDASSIASKVS